MFSLLSRWCSFAINLIRNKGTRVAIKKAQTENVIRDETRVFFMVKT